MAGPLYLIDPNIQALVSTAAEQPPATYVVETDQDGDDTWDGNGDDLKVLLPPRGTGLSIVRGADSVQAIIPPRAGSLTLDLDNLAGDYSVGSFMVPRLPIRVRGMFNLTTHELFQGVVDTVSPQSEITRQSVRVQALGPLSEFAGLTGYSTEVYENITTDAAIEHVLDAVGWPAGKRVLDTGTRTLTLWWLDGAEDVLQALVQLVNTEGPHASLYEDGDGNIVFEADDYRTTQGRSTAVQSTYRAHTTEPVFSRILRYDDGLKAVVNRVELEQRRRALPDPPMFVHAQSTQFESQNTAQATANGAEAGDLALIGLFWTGAVTVTIDGVTTAGGELLASGTAGTGNYRLYRIVLTQSAQAFTWVFSGNYTNAVVPYYFVRADGILDDWSADVRTDDASPASASITTLGASRRIVSIIMGVSASTGLTVPTGMTELDNDASGSIVFGTAEVVQESAGATGAKEWTGAAGGDDLVVFIAAVAPSGEAVWRAGEEIVLGNDETRTLTVTSSDPIQNAIAPVEDADFTVSAGALASTPTLDRTSGTSVQITLVADTAGATIQGPPGEEDKGMRLRGTRRAVSSTTRVLAEDATSQASYGKRGLPALSYRAELSLTDMQTLADDYLAAYKDPRPICTVDVLGDRDTTTLADILSREISDRVRVIESRASIDLTGWIEQIRHDITNQTPTTSAQITLRGVVA